MPNIYIDPEIETPSEIFKRAIEAGLKARVTVKGRVISDHKECLKILDTSTEYDDIVYSDRKKGEIKFTERARCRALSKK